MPIVLVLLFVFLLLALWVVLLPLSLWQRYRYGRSRRMARGWLLAFNAWSLLVSVAISVLLMLKQMSAADIQVLGRIDGGHDFVDLQRHPTAATEPGVLIVRPGEALFFANVERVLGAALHLIRHSGAPLHTVILSLEETPDLDGTSIEAMQEIQGLGDACLQLGKAGFIIGMARCVDPSQQGSTSLGAITGDLHLAA